MLSDKYKIFAEELLLYDITSEPTESPTPLPYVSQPPTTLTPLDCNIHIYVIITAATSIFTTLCVIFTAYYLREKCRSKYLNDIASSSFSSLSSHVIDMESDNSDEILWFEDVYVDK